MQHSFWLGLGAIGKSKATSGQRNMAGIGLKNTMRSILRIGQALGRPGVVSCPTGALLLRNGRAFGISREAFPCSKQLGIFPVGIRGQLRLLEGVRSVEPGFAWI